MFSTSKRQVFHRERRDALFFPAIAKIVPSGGAVHAFGLFVVPHRNRVVVQRKLAGHAVLEHQKLSACGGVFAVFHVADDRIDAVRVVCRTGNRIILAHVALCLARMSDEQHRNVVLYGELF